MSDPIPTLFSPCRVEEPLVIDDEAQTLMQGFWVFLMSDLILFGIAFVSYVTSEQGLAGGPGPKVLYDLKSVAAETALLLTSSLTFGMASLCLKFRQRQDVLMAWLGLTLVLGVAFLGLELHDFATMAGKGGVPARSGYLSAFFGLVPLHGVHVLGGCVWLCSLMIQVLRFGLDRDTTLGLMRLALFWHLLDVIWIGIFSVVFLWGLT